MIPRLHKIMLRVADLDHLPPEHAIRELARSLAEKVDAHAKDPSPEKGKRVMRAWELARVGWSVYKLTRAIEQGQV